MVVLPPLPISRGGGLTTSKQCQGLWSYQLYAMSGIGCATNSTQCQGRVVLPPLLIIIELLFYYLYPISRGGGTTTYDLVQIKVVNNLSTTTNIQGLMVSLLLTNGKGC